MRVISLDIDKLTGLCKQLTEQISESGFHPDVIIGIKSGGAEVGKILKKLFPDSRYVECDIERASTKRKKHLLKHILKFFPRVLLDRMRIIEAKTRFKYKKRNDISGIRLSDIIERGCRILMIDDAVDSGATLSAVKAEILRKYPDSEIRSAAITVTTENPVAMPDFFVFHNSILIRFPWSMDAR